MTADKTDPSDEYDVVVNGEEQYSIWPVGRDAPDGWRAIGVRGQKAECLQRIDELWTDMRPRSLREAMAKGDES
jgi:MbtH protein